MNEENKVMNYEEVMDAWINAYRFCLSYESKIVSEKVPEEEFEEYLNDKAKLIVSTVDILLTKCVDDKGTYDKEYIEELYTGFKNKLQEQEIELIPFDKDYIDKMVKELDEDILKQQQDEIESNTSEDEE